MNRRQVLKALGLGVVAIASVPLLEACSQPAPASQKPADASKPAATTAGQAASKPAESKPAQAAAPTAAASKPATQAAAGAPKRGGEITVVVQNDWVTFDPPFNTAEPGGSNMIFGSWMNWEADASGKWGPTPDLVAEWDARPDALTLKLQKGVTFHDGSAWDAKAAKWNLDRLIFHPASGVRSNLRGVDMSKEDQAEIDKMKANQAGPFTFSSKAVEVVDDSTVRVRFSAPNASIVSVLTTPGAAPIGAAAYNAVGKDAFGRKPVGSGPYRFVEWQSGSHVVLEKNPDYWRKTADGQPLPYLDKLTYRLIIDDSVRLLELRSGNAHFTELVQGKDVAGIKADPNLTIVESQASGNNYRVIFDATNPESPFRNVKLRQAMLYCLDREAMAKTLGFASGVARKYLLPKGSSGYDESEKTPYYAFDKAKAAALLKDAVAEDKSLGGSDGKVAFTFTVIDRAVDKAQSEMIKQMADAVGFNTTLETLERAAWTAKLVKRPGQPGGKFEMGSMRNPVTADDPDSQFRTFYHSLGSYNVAHVDDKEWDRMIDEAGASFDDTKRKQMYIDLEKRAFDQAWYSTLWQQNWNWVFNKKLTNFQEPVTNRWDFTETWMA
ncbi:MAG: ABC transporter substrate-binding protein [Chloroflexi bacterium]|nr:ABC transporter substrate-binding protein [Chloroflexota bacterium]